MSLGRWLLVGVALLVVGVPLLLYASAQLSLDRERAHRRRTAELPMLSPRGADGLVQIPARGHVFRARVAGRGREGPALLLLHGFPETSVMWAPLIEAAAGAGFRVAAFDQRGYSPGARPEVVDAYAVPELEADALAVADALGFERFHLVGHDWGSIVGWVLAAQHPDRVLSWTSLSIPHPGAILAAQEGAGQPLYVTVFRAPGVPETLFTFSGLAVMRHLLYQEMAPSHLEEYLAVFSEPGALTAALNWYRAMPEDAGPWGLGNAEIAQPTLYVYGNRDMPVFVGPKVQAQHPRFLKGPLTVLELDAGHWLIQEQPERVVEAVMAHLEKQAP